MEITIYINVYPSGTTLHGTLEDAERSACSNLIQTLPRNLHIPVPPQGGMFSAMRDIFYGGEFSHWLDKQESIPFAALREFEEAEQYFCKQTGFEIPRP